MSKMFCRALLLTLAVCAFSVAAPAVADQTLADATQAQAATPQPAGCGSIVDLFTADASASVCKQDAQMNLQPEPVFMGSFHGYCRCSCSLIKNCNTSADCGGSLCLGGVTCC